jgi:hypothetical protein
MKLAIHYLNDSRGNVKAVQLAYRDWEKMLSKVEKYDQITKFKTELEESFSEMKKIRNGELKKETLYKYLSKSATIFNRKVR